MAKDPAILWYWSDWNSGTSTMTRFLKGCYIDLLHAQYNSGPLSLEEIKTVLGSDFGSSWPAIQKKFKSENGLFFNERLELEKQKRKVFTDSRRSNRLKSTSEKDMKNTSKTYVPHMENGNRDVNESIRVGGVGEGPPFENIHMSFVQQGGTKEMAEQFYNTHEATGWRTRNGPIGNYVPLISNYIKNWKQNETNSNRSGRKPGAGKEQLNAENAAAWINLGRTADK